jgi:organic radical activating enzyme
MPKQNNETDLEYKRRVIDIKSVSFCGAKWYNATIWLGSGQTTSCHHPLPHAIDLHEISQNPAALHNTTQKKKEREQMQRGERPAGCDYCWKIEDMNQDAISDRVYKTVIHSEEDLNVAFARPSYTDFNLRTLEIAFDRTCQFACSYCNPAFSSTWVNDIRKNGAYINLVSDGRNHYTHAHDHSQLYKFGETNPYVEAFFKWWESDLHRTLTELRITGGEPLMSGHTWQLIDWFKQNQGRSNTRLAINTNLGREVDVDRLLESTRGIELDIYTSNETITAQAEYIRDGLDWPAWVNNMEKIAKSGIRGLHVMCTINALCLPGLPAFITTMMMFKKSYSRNFPSMSFNILRFPSFQSPYVLPLALRQTYADAIEQILVQYQDDILMHEHEVNQLTRLVAYLREPVAGPDLPRMQNDFKQFYAQYDQRRGKNFVETFPELKEFYEQIH